MQAKFFEWINKEDLDEIRSIKRTTKLKNHYEEELEEEETDIISFISKYGADERNLSCLGV